MKQFHNIKGPLGILVSMGENLTWLVISDVKPIIYGLPFSLFFFQVKSKKCVLRCARVDELGVEVMKGHEPALSQKMFITEHVGNSP